MCIILTPLMDLVVLDHKNASRFLNSIKNNIDIDVFKLH